MIEAIIETISYLFFEVVWESARALASHPLLVLLLLVVAGMVVTFVTYPPSRVPLSILGGVLVGGVTLLCVLPDDAKDPSAGGGERNASDK